MKRPEDEILFRDMVDHARRAIAAVAGRRREDLDVDHVLAAALERFIEVVGEAASIRTDRRDGSGLRPRYRFSVPKADLLSLFVRPLNQLGWAYAVPGAVGSMFYAEPRADAGLDALFRRLFS